MRGPGPRSPRLSTYKGEFSRGMASRRRTSRRKSRSGTATLLLLIFVLGLAAAAAGAWLVLAPYGPSTETLVQIPPGSSTLRIGRILESAGVIRSQYAF